MTPEEQAAAIKRARSDYYRMREEARAFWTRETSRERLESETL